MKKILQVILIISISLMVLVTSIELNSYNKSYFLSSYQNNNVLEVTGRTLDELEIITIDLIDYLKGNGNAELLLPHFNEKEILHMKDVQELFNMAKSIKYITIIISITIVLYSFKKGFIEELVKKTINGLFSNHIIIVVLFSIISTDFNKYWTMFHKIFFTNDLWLLNPHTDLMIQMLPEEFFSGISLRIGLSFFMLLSIIQIIGFYYLKKGRDKWRGMKE